MRRILLAAVSLTVLAGAASAADPKGDWMVNDKTAVIRVAPCGKALCGTLAWSKTPGGLDENNPDPNKRKNPLLGVKILVDMKPSTTPNKWEGEVYNPENGKTYNSNIVLVSEKVLHIEGCLIGGFLCGGEDWTRVK
jgi:uncharacterized protein (DUF2147 family)